LSSQMLRNLPDQLTTAHLRRSISMRRSGFLRGLILISMLLVMCPPAEAQYQDKLGGTWNNPTSASIMNIIMDRYARRRLEKRMETKHTGPASSTASPSVNDGAVRFRSTGTQLKTREIANLMDAGNPQVFTLLTTILQEFDK